MIMEGKSLLSRRLAQLHCDRIGASLLRAAGAHRGGAVARARTAGLTAASVSEPTMPYTPKTFVSPMTAAGASRPRAPAPPVHAPTANANSREDPALSLSLSPSLRAVPRLRSNDDPEELAWSSRACEVLGRGQGAPLVEAGTRAERRYHAVQPQSDAGSQEAPRAGREHRDARQGGQAEEGWHGLVNGPMG